MLQSLWNTCKGKVVTRKPNQVSTKDRNPHYGMTKNFCLIKTCPWSEGAEERRRCESQARASVDGVVRTKVMLTLMKVEEDMPLDGAPLLLNWVYGKLKALVRHIISPNYSNYDLQIRFDTREWKIDLVGYLYLKEYDDINVKIASEGAGLEEIVLEIEKHWPMMPTVCIKAEDMEKYFNFSQEEAEALSALVREHQIGDKNALQPLSLFDLNTTSTVQDVKRNEMYFRKRAAQLGELYKEGGDTYAAISDICKTMMEEGFADIASCYVDDGDRMRRSLAAAFGGSDAAIEDHVVKYHCLLNRTGAKGEWTHLRQVGESRVQPYIPLLLAANACQMTADVCFHGEEIQEEFGLGQGLSGLPCHFLQNWKEISVLEFINGCMPEKAPKVTGSASQVTVDIQAERNEDMAWRQGHDGDTEEEVFLNKDNQPYIRTTGDFRIKYELRPKSLDVMSLAQMATEYRILKSKRETYRQRSYDKIKSEIDPITRVGPPSDGLIAGADNRAAPVSMKLMNNKIMVRRTRGANAVPLLLFSGALNRYSSRLLFQPWRELESIRVDQQDLETATQRRTRLQLFPMSVFPICNDTIDEEEET